MVLRPPLPESEVSMSAYSTRDIRNVALTGHAATPGEAAETKESVHV